MVDISSYFRECNLIRSPWEFETIYLLCGDVVRWSRSNKDVHPPVLIEKSAEEIQEEQLAKVFG